ncbi:MAG: trypsin-like serine protease [Pyrinomonadaceae bacterium]
MSFIRATFVLRLCLAAAVLLGTGAVTYAITYGFVDEKNTYSNTGAFIVQRASDGHIFPICSGTLISSTVFLTASHCTDFYTRDLAPRGFSAFISFDNPIPFGNLTTRNTKLIAVSQVVTNPNYNQAQNDTGDIAVLLVSGRSTRGITPAALPTFGLLDEMAAKNGLTGTKYTAAGYGLQNRVVGGGVPYFQDQNPIPRMYSFSSFDALNNTFLRLSQNPSTGDGGTCYGDSGGPNFLNVNGVRTLVGITITGDAVCRATNTTYRTDTASARSFLAPFVALP